MGCFNAQKRVLYVIKKVTYAIIALNELHDYCADNQSGKQMEIHRLAFLCDISSDDLLPILNLLHHFEYVELKNDTVALSCFIDEVTLYDLITTLHGGFPIGEEVEHDYHGLDYYSDPKYSKIVHLEADIRDIANKQLRYILLRRTEKLIWIESSYI